MLQDRNQKEIEAYLIVKTLQYLRWAFRWQELELQMHCPLLNWHSGKSYVFRKLPTPKRWRKRVFETRRRLWMCYPELAIVFQIALLYSHKLMDSYFIFEHRVFQSKANGLVQVKIANIICHLRESSERVRSDTNPKKVAQAWCGWVLGWEPSAQLSSL